MFTLPLAGALPPIDAGAIPLVALLVVFAVRAVRRGRRGTVPACSTASAPAAEHDGSSARTGARRRATA